MTLKYWHAALQLTLPYACYCTCTYTCIVLYVKAVESGDKMFIIQSTALDVLYVSNMLV